MVRDRREEQITMFSTKEETDVGKVDAILDPALEELLQLYDQRLLTHQISCIRKKLLQNGCLTLNDLELLSRGSRGRNYDFFKSFFFSKKLILLCCHRCNEFKFEVWKKRSWSPYSIALTKKPTSDSKHEFFLHVEPGITVYY